MVNFLKSKSLKQQQAEAAAKKAEEAELARQNAVARVKADKIKFQALITAVNETLDPSGQPPRLDVTSKPDVEWDV